MPPKRTLTWKLYLSDALPGCLHDAGVDRIQVDEIVDDIARRARDYALGGRASRRTLRVPFIDDVAGFLPQEAPPAVKADTAVVVRNSLLENAHARGPVQNTDLVTITALATGALNVWLCEHANTDEHAPVQGVFAASAEYNRAHSALQALALAAESGGRRSFRMPLGNPPSRLVGTPVRRGTNSNMAVRSGLDPLDDDLIARLNSIADGTSPLGFCSSLSRYSRDSTLLNQVLDFILAHDAFLLTTNFLIRPGEVFSRRPPFITACSSDSLSVLSLDRMPGLAAKYTRIAMRQAAADQPIP